MPADDHTDATAPSDYVTNAVWLRPSGRPDAIDEVADQFERRAGAGTGSGIDAFWSPAPVNRWPVGSRGWRPSRREVA